MRYDFLIFGGTGIQGRICAKDILQNGHSCLLAGRDPSGIKEILQNKKASFIKIDLRNKDELEKIVKNFSGKIVINCAELSFNVEIMKTCLKFGKHCTDLGGLQQITKEQFKLHKEFKKKNLICITGCGSTPGILNVLVAYVVKKFDSVETIDLGFAWNSNIKKFVIPYSMESIFEEFTEKPITFHGGKFKKENRLICRGEIDFPYVGRQEIYCIVHSEVYSFARYFKKLGLKNVHYLAGFPPHSFEVIQTLLQLGFDSKEKMTINGFRISPIDFTNQVLKKLKTPRGYKETENLWAKVYGKIGNREVMKEINCVVRTVKGWENAGSNVDTGRTISVISQMLHNKQIFERGVFAPEAVIPQGEFLKELSKRKMFVYLDGKKIN